MPFQKGHKIISPKMLGKKHSEETKRKISEAHRGLKKPWAKPPVRYGADSHLWRGGITPINAKIRSSLEYRLWRRAVFERDNYTCIWCGVKNGDGKTIVLQADHIKPFALFPELRFAIDNGRTLCKPCHQTTETFGEKAKRYIIK